MLSNAKLTVGAALAVLAILVPWIVSASRDVVTQAQLTGSVGHLDNKLMDVASKIERMSGQLSGIDSRLSRLEGRMESRVSSPPSP